MIMYAIGESIFSRHASPASVRREREYYEASCGRARLAAGEELTAHVQGCTVEPYAVPVTFDE
jgi:hypothetical protein